MSKMLRLRGRCISILPGGQPSCHTVVGQRRFILQTAISPFARDPIIGNSGDVIVVFPGEVGTLVELAYAALQNRPIVFCMSRNELKQMKDAIQVKLNTKLDEASAVYGLIRTERNELNEKLSASFELNETRVSVGNIEEAVERAFELSEHFDRRKTNFLGLSTAMPFTNEFEELVRRLSA
jgi:hypothetical protein